MFARRFRRSRLVIVIVIVVNLFEMYKKQKKNSCKMSTMKSKRGKSIQNWHHDVWSAGNNQQTVNIQKFVCTKWFTNREIFPSPRMCAACACGCVLARSVRIHYTPIIRSSSEFLILSFVRIAYNFAFDFCHWCCCCCCCWDFFCRSQIHTNLNILCRLFSHPPPLCSSSLSQCVSVFALCAINEIYKLDKTNW